MNKFILGLSFLGLAISCGKDISNRPQDRVSYIESSVGKPFTLQFLDEKCMLSAATGEVNTKISLFNTIQYQIFDVPKSDVLNLKVLNPSNATNELDIVELFTVAGSYDYKYFYQKKHNKYVLDSRELKGEKSFTLCAGRDYSKEESYQSAAASAYYSFDSIEKQLKPLNLNLPKIKVRIAPKVKQVSDFRHGRRIQRKEEVLVNNAYYDYKADEIVFLPQGLNKMGVVPFSGVPLWKLPLVTSHEYGHHVFSNIMQSYYKVKKKETAASHRLCFDSRLSEDIKEEPKQIIRKINLDLVISAVNEGFADLFARYTTDEKFKLKGISCLEYSRDVDHPMFANGEKKILSREVINKFLNPVRFPTKSCNGDVDYQDVHILGAVIANSFHKLYESAGFDRLEKLKFTIKWLQQVDKNYKHYEKMELKDVLDSIVKLGADGINLNQKDMNPKYCQIIENSLPVVYDLFTCE